MSNTTCEVRMNNEVHQSDDFVCVMADEEVGARMLYNADAVTLGMAAQLTLIAYQREFAALSEEDQKAVMEALNLNTEPEPLYGCDCEGGCDCACESGEPCVEGGDDTNE